MSCAVLVAVIVSIHTHTANPRSVTELSDGVKGEPLSDKPPTSVFRIAFARRAICTVRYRGPGTSLI